MLAFGDNLSHRGWPIATWVITLITSVVYVASASSAVLMEQLIAAFGFVPLHFSINPASNLYTLVTAEFLHLDAIHLLGNLIFLLSFGRAVEGAIGSLRFAAAFVSLGALGFLGSWLASPDFAGPIIGNSGAVSFLLGGYMLLFPRAHIRLLPIFAWPYFPAWLFASLWVGGQVVGALTIGEAVSGVAYYTHIAGLLLGGVAAACWREFGTDTQRRIADIDGSQT